MNNVDDISSSEFLTTQQVWSLAQRNFFITVDVTYGCIGKQKTDRIFTGLASGGTITQKAGMMTMQVKLSDYMKILNQSYIFNSPFFDGMKDSCAVFQLLQMAHLRQTSPQGPSWLLKAQASVYGDFSSAISQNGISRNIKSTHYALPQTYDRLNSAKFRFTDGSTVGDSISDLAKRAGKVAYFDNYGIFHYENRAFDQAIFSQQSNTAPPVSSKNASYVPIWQWRDSPSQPNTGIAQSRSALATLMHDSLSIGFAVQDAYSQFLMITTTPDGPMLRTGYVQYDRVYGGSNPIRPAGWLGYKKRMQQTQGLFGNQNALKATLDSFAKFIYPPRTVKFQSYGMPVRALDVGQIVYTSHGYHLNAAQKLPFIILNTSSTINPKQQTWTMDIDGQWLGMPVF